METSNDIIDDFINTWIGRTPVLVMRFEGHTEKALRRIEATFMAALRSVKPDAQIATAAH